MKKLNIQDWSKMMGQKCIIYQTDRQGSKCNTIGDVAVVDLNRIGVGHEFPNYYITFHCINDCKPVLRRVEDMTKEEKEELMRISNSKTRSECECCIQHDTSILFIDTSISDWLESKGFDIRGWIDEGLAVDAKTVKEDNNE